MTAKIRRMSHCRRPVDKQVVRTMPAAMFLGMTMPGCRSFGLFRRDDRTISLRVLFDGFEFHCPSLADSAAEDLQAANLAAELAV